MEKEARPKSACVAAEHHLVEKLATDVQMLAEDENDTKKLTPEPEIDVHDMQLTMTPKSRKRTAKEATLLQTPKSAAVAQAEQLQTPRRSVRKSIKPKQDYEDIVAKKSLRSLKKAEKQSSVDEETEHEEEKEDKEKEAPKWTPAKVGRVSQKRKSRKSRKTIGKKQQENDDEQRIKVDIDVLEVIANDEDENKENVEPQELLRNRKSPKNENKGATTRNSQETYVSLSVEALPLNQPSNSISASLENKEVANAIFDSSNCGKTVKEQAQSDLIRSEEAVVANKKDNDNFNAPNPKGSNEANGTFNSSDCIIISLELEQVVESVVEKEMHTMAPIEIKALPLDQPSNAISTSLENKEVANAIFDSSNCGTTVEEQVQKDPIRCEEAVAANKNDDDNYNTPNPKDSNEANSTLNSSDCILISPELEQVVESVVQKEMQTLAPIEKNLNTSMPSFLISDDDEHDDEEQENIDEKCDDSEPLAKIPKICINNEEYVSQTPHKAITKVNIVAPIVATSSGTPKMCKTKPYRFPTPYKSRVQQNFNFKFNNKQEEADTNTEDDISSSALPSVVFKLTNMEPKDIVLRSIRKRSLSVCHDQPPRKQFNRVTFNSPANQTTIIPNIALPLANSAKKSMRRMRGGHMNSVVSDTSNVTKRRKRSLSVDEALMARIKVQQAPLTPSKLRSTPQKVQSRTKIPNFAAIHQRQFNKMENLLDHVTRKAERAKVLTTSASKLREMSAQKGGISSNNQNIEPSSGVEGGAAVAATGTTHARVGRPKALKKIDLSDNTIKPALPIVASKKSNDDEDNSNKTAINLPNPQPFKNLLVVQPMPSGKKLQAHPIQKQQAKPAFNLSTNLKKQTANSSILDRTASTSNSSTLFRKQPVCVNTTITTKPSFADKEATRRQRHMDMYKGRGVDKSSRHKNSKDKEKSIEIIRGVRSNRRFDLQMQHRKNLNQDNI